MNVFAHIDALRKASVTKSVPKPVPDWRALMKQHGPAGEHQLVIADGLLDKEDPLEVASHLVFWNGPFFIDVPDTEPFRKALAKVGKPFVYADESSKGRLYLSSLDVAGAVAIGETFKSTADLSKPFAGFDNFEACVVDMTGKGYSKEAAQKICGTLQAEHEEKAQAKTEKSKQYAVKLLSKAEDDAPDEERIVYGIVLEPEEVDSQGDIYSADEIKKACYLFMEEFGHFKIQHKGEYVDGGLVTLENFLVPCDYETVNAYGEKVTVKKGTWIHGARVNEPDLWTATKKGEFTGWSIGGWSGFTKP